jgi:hypothetical protein
MQNIIGRTTLLAPFLSSRVQVATLEENMASAERASWALNDRAEN